MQTDVQKTLVNEINEEHRACEEAARSAVGHAIRAGEMLSEVKAELPHGAFGSWLRDNFGSSARTARSYMKLAVNKDELSNWQHASDLSIREALRELEPPKEEKREPVEPSRKHLTGGLLYQMHWAEMGELKEAAEEAGVSELEICRRIHRGLYRAHGEGEISRGGHWEKAKTMWHLAEIVEASGEARNYLYSELTQLDEKVTPADLPPSNLKEIISKRIDPKERGDATIAEFMSRGLIRSHRDALNEEGLEDTEDDRCQAAGELREKALGDHRPAR